MICKNYIEDEIQYLLEYPKYIEERRQFLVNRKQRVTNLKTLADESKRFWLMSSQDPKIIKLSNKYLV